MIYRSKEIDRGLFSEMKQRITAERKFSGKESGRVSRLKTKIETEIPANYYVFVAIALLGLAGAGALAYGASHPDTAYAWSDNPPNWQPEINPLPVNLNCSVPKTAQGELTKNQVILANVNRDPAPDVIGVITSDPENNPDPQNKENCVLRFTGKGLNKPEENFENAALGGEAYISAQGMNVSILDKGKQVFRATLTGEGRMVAGLKEPQVKVAWMEEVKNPKGKLVNYQEGWVGLDAVRLIAESPVGQGGETKIGNCEIGAVVQIKDPSFQGYGEILAPVAGQKTDILLVKTEQGQKIPVNRESTVPLKGLKVKSLIPPKYTESSTVNEIVASKIDHGQVMVKLIWTMNGQKIAPTMWFTLDHLSAPIREASGPLACNGESAGTVDMAKLKAYRQNLETLERERPDLYQKLGERAKKIVVNASKNFREDQDLAIMTYHRADNLDQEKEQLLDEEVVLEALAWHQVKYLENPVVKRIVQDMLPGTKAINKLLRDRLSPDLFSGNRIPQLPESPDVVLSETVFGGGGETLGGGEAPAKFVTIFGRYDLLNLKDPGDLLQAKNQLPHDLWHENIHRLIQNQAKEKGSPFWEQGGDLWHLTMGLLEVVGTNTLGVNQEIDPKLIYIYSRLKVAGIEDPYSLLLQAAATANEKKLWQTYESSRKPGDLSMEELIALKSSNALFSSLSQTDKESFKKEYFAYIVR